MINHSPNIASFQTFWLSKEHSKCPVVANIVKFIKKLDFLNTITISCRFGKRVLINSKNVDLKKISEEEFVEIVDYDPFKRILLVIGKYDISNEAPLHWYIHHAREDINAILSTKNEYIVEKNKKIPTVDNRYPLWTIEQIKEVLRALRESKIVIIKDTALLMVGNSLRDVENSILDYVRKNESRRK